MSDSISGFIKLPVETLNHAKLVLKITRRSIRLSSYGGQDKDYEPICTHTEYDGLKDALKDLVTWNNARNKRRDA